jgi:UMF1 family MFS transporter
MVIAQASAAPVDDRREILGWTMYDWANSAFSTTVIAALLGPYILSLAGSSTTPLRLFGAEIEPAAIFPFATSLSVLLQVLFLPLLGVIADFTNLKKPMLITFAYTGAGATILLFFIRSDMPGLGTNGAVLLGSLLYLLANLSFGAAVVFYNAFLPDIASPAHRDAVSSRGFAFGYLGGGLLLLANFGLLLMMDDTALAVRMSLASAGVWWLLFTYLFPQQRLRQREAARRLPPGTNFFVYGFRQVGHTLREMRAKYPMTLRYLIAYLIYNDGIQTVIIVASSFAADELGVPPDRLLLLVLLIQFTAFGGAFLFGYLARRLGAKRAIMISLVIWSVAVILSYAILYTEIQLFILGAIIAIVLGGSQALSRSLFAQMIPADHEAEYFGFYEISERGTSWLGPLLFGLAVQLTGSQRVAILALIVFFVTGLILLSRVNVHRAIVESGNDPTGVIL